MACKWDRQYFLHGQDHPHSQTRLMLECVCVCVCVFEREGEIEIDREKEREPSFWGLLYPFLSSVLSPTLLPLLSKYMSIPCTLVDCGNPSADLLLDLSSLLDFSINLFLHRPLPPYHRDRLLLSCSSSSSPLRVLGGFHDSPAPDK